MSLLEITNPYLVGVTSWLLNRAPDYRKWLSILGGMLVSVLGFNALIRTILVT